MIRHNGKTYYFLELSWKSDHHECGMYDARFDVEDEQGNVYDCEGVWWAAPDEYEIIEIIGEIKTK